MTQEGRRPVPTVDELERLIGQLAGVQSVRIVINDWGAIEEIHVLASTERTAKQLVRDVESSLAARWGIHVDHKKISVAQLTEAAPPISALRVKLMGVQLAMDNRLGRAEAKVTLGRADDDKEVYEGEAQGSGSRNGILRVVGEATLNAVGRMVDPSNVLALEEVGAITLSHRELVVVTVVLVSPRRNEEVLVGAVTLKGDPANAAAKAVLDAVNRRLGKLVARRTRPQPGS
ncbi:MAG TPA: hypothetical protein DCM14_05935 [Clostridiales bacterium UBA8153]|nr:hypothetical protein [Clostridiales bacterium UBA8153]